LGILKRAFDAAKRKGLIVENPASLAEIDRTATIDDTLTYLHSDEVSLLLGCKLCAAASGTPASDVDVLAACPHMPFEQRVVFTLATHQAPREGELAGMNFHDLRDTAATHLLSGSWGPAWSMEQVSKHLGHSSVKITEARYAHLTRDAKRRAAESVDSERKQSANSPHVFAAHTHKTLQNKGSGSWTRTNDQSVNSRSLYQLSYSGIGGRRLAWSHPVSRPSRAAFGQVSAFRRPPPTRLSRPRVSVYGKLQLSPSLAGHGGPSGESTGRLPCPSSRSPQGDSSGTS
jgi:hypothetical protein